MNNERQYWYQAFTLVDITATGVTKFNTDTVKQRNQQRNWESVQQVLGLRTQIFDLSQSQTKDNVKHYEFGDIYKGNHKVWSFKFAVEFDSIYKLLNNDLAVLEKDFEQTPIIVGLEETAKFPISLFYTNGAEKNIYFKILKSEVNNSVVDA